MKGKDVVVALYAFGDWLVIGYVFSSYIRCTFSIATCLQTSKSIATWKRPKANALCGAYAYWYIGYLDISHAAPSCFWIYTMYTLCNLLLKVFFRWIACNGDGIKHVGVLDSLWFYVSEREKSAETRGSNPSMGAMSINANAKRDTFPLSGCVNCINHK